jgi:tRNA(fMet)-specific endonuclease VapC
MPLYVLDTDSLSLYARGNENIIAEYAKHAARDIVVSVITVEEQISGWYDLARRAQDAESLERAYLRLSEAIEILSGFSVLPFTRPAIARYESLKGMKLNIGKMDMRIASIVLEDDAILVTRNLRDFARIPHLKIENWAD